MSKSLLSIIALSASVITAAAAWTASGTTDDGALIPPFSHVFTEANDFDNYTILDLDGQGKWQMEPGSDPGEYIPCVKGTSGYYNVPPMNDWLITPALKLEKGRAYRVTVRMSSQSNANPERFEVKYGSEATADGMTVSIIEPTEITNTKGRDFDGYMIPDNSGNFFLGVHGISDPNSWRLYCEYIKIGEATPLTAPGAPVNVTVTPDPQWEMKATVSFTTPGIDMAGNTLTGNMDVDIYREGEKIGTVTGCTPSAEYSFIDNNEQGTLMDSPQIYEYTVVARNTSGQGYIAKASNYIGPNEPGQVENITVVETEPGLVKVSWDAPSIDKNSNPIPADKVRYAISRLGDDEKVLALNLTETSITDRVCAPDDNAFACYRIIAMTDAGRALGVNSPTIPVGTSYSIPYIESFADAGLDHLHGTEVVEYSGSQNPVAGLVIDADYPSVGSSDNDNGYLYARMPQTGDKIALFSAKVNLAGLQSPKLAVNIFKFSSSHANPVEVMVRCPGEDFETIATLSTGDFTETGWHKAVADIPAKFFGKTIQYRLVMANTSSQNSFIDRIAIFQSADINLAARKLTIQDEPVAGAPISLKVSVDNMGDKEVSSYTVELYKDGVKVDEQNVSQPIAPDSSADVEFTHTVAVTEAPYHTFQARVLADGDTVEADDLTPEMKVEVISPNYPVAENLTATGSAESVVELTWDAPDLSKLEPKHVVEGFENYDDHTTDLAPFVNYDGDKLASGTYTDEDIPGITGEPAAWYVIDSTNEGNNVGNGNNGSDKFIMVAYTEDDEAEVNKNDDWIITPELFGGAQIISFYVRCRGEWYPENIEILVSFTDNSPESFTSLGEIEIDTEEWAPVYVSVPDGGKYIAVRYISEDMYYIAIDDIEYAPAGGEAMFTLLGYNIYRNGERLNDTPVTGTNYTDRLSVSSGEFTYAVSAVYDCGESALSNEVMFQTTGISLTPMSADTPAEYFDIAGISVAKGTVSNPEPKLPAGIYLRRAAGTTSKIIIK